MRQPRQCVGGPASDVGNVVSEPTIALVSESRDVQGPAEVDVQDVLTIAVIEFYPNIVNSRRLMRSMVPSCARPKTIAPRRGGKQPGVNRTDPVVHTGVSPFSMRR